MKKKSVEEGIKDKDDEEDESEESIEKKQLEWAAESYIIIPANESDMNQKVLL